LDWHNPPGAWRSPARATFEESDGMGIDKEPWISRYRISVEAFHRLSESGESWRSIEALDTPCIVRPVAAPDIEIPLGPLFTD